MNKCWRPSWKIVVLKPLCSQIFYDLAYIIITMMFVFCLWLLIFQNSIKNDLIVNKNYDIENDNKVIGTDIENEINKEIRMCCYFNNYNNGNINIDNNINDSEYNEG